MMNIIEISNDRFALQHEYLGKKKIINTLEPLVSVTVATYQHAPYIKDCLNGILMQKTSFPFEIILGEDDSTDGTREICKEYAEKYPHKIRLFLRDKKLSLLSDENGDLITRFNSYWNRLSARGKYIAWCDGDDYWLDPNKLQKQIDFLEEHEEFVITFHDSIIVDKDKNLIFKSFLNDYSKIEMLGSPYILTCTALFRNIINDYPEFFIKSPTHDTLLWHLLGFYGAGKFIRNINSSAYRLHHGSAWSSLNNRDQAKIALKMRKLIKTNLVSNFGKSHIAVKNHVKRIRRVQLKYLISLLPFVGNLVIYIYQYLKTNIALNGKLFPIREQYKSIKKWIYLRRNLSAADSKSAATPSGKGPLYP